MAWGCLSFWSGAKTCTCSRVLAVYAGFSMKQEHVEPGPDLAPYVQDALDEMEYVTGDASTKWGARTREGRPSGAIPARPMSRSATKTGSINRVSYDGRYAQFYDAIKAQYPQLQLIATAPVKSISPMSSTTISISAPKSSSPTADHYDKTDRNGPKIFVGEWATREGPPTPNLNAALGDAAWMTGMERNSDVIIMASYAPLLTNVNAGGMQWEYGSDRL